MPHKRNPVGAAVLIGAATRVPGLLSTLFAAMPQEHERSLGLWHAEWETLPDICCLVSGALRQAQVIAEGMEVDAARMRRNLDLTQGLVLAEAVSIVLAQRLGRDRAHHLLEQCCQRAVAEQRHLRAVLVTSRRSAPSCLAKNSIACSTLPITWARPASGWRAPCPNINVLLPEGDRCGALATGRWRFELPDRWPG